MEDFSYKEIAELMQVSVSSVESMIFRAKKNLKLTLESFYKNQ
jgi:RNA polymerase sigma-70 factor (ECF subfamily)